MPTDLKLCSHFWLNIDCLSACLHIAVAVDALRKIALHMTVQDETDFF